MYFSPEIRKPLIFLNRNFFYIRLYFINSTSKSLLLFIMFLLYCYLKKLQAIFYEIKYFPLYGMEQQICSFVHTFRELCLPIEKLNMIAEQHSQYNYFSPLLAVL